MKSRADKIRDHANTASAKLAAMAIGASEHERIVIETAIVNRPLLDNVRELHREAEEHVRYIGELLKLYD